MSILSAKLSERSHYLIMAVILIIGAIYLHADVLALFPTHIHAWTQSDRLAIAMNFQQNGFDFFHPATYNLLTKDGITQVDFPIHDYLIAIFSKVLGSDLVFTFRLYNLIYSLVGLFFLFRLGLLLFQEKWKAYFLSLLVFCLPFYVYYQSGFLPSVPSFANILIAYYFLFRFYKQGKPSQLYLALFFLVLAALARLPLAIFLMAVLIQRIWEWRKDGKFPIKEVIAFAIAFLPLIIYYFYNRHLASTYGSMFLQQFLPISSGAELKRVLLEMGERWQNAYFSPYQLVAILTLWIVAAFGLLKNAYRSALQAKIGTQFAIAFAAALAFFFLLGQQFVDHDYYFLDSFLPSIVLLLLLSLKQIRLSEHLKAPVLAIVGIFSLYFLSEAKAEQEKRYTPAWNDLTLYAYESFQQTAGDLDDWGIAKEDTIMVMDAFSTNIPFIAWQRRGYSILNTGRDTIEKYLQKPIDYVAIMDSLMISEVLEGYFDISYQLDYYQGNGRMSFYKPSTDKDSIGFFRNFIARYDFDMEDMDPLRQYPWQGNAQLATQEGSQNQYLQIDEQQEFILTMKDTLKTLLDDQSLQLVVEGDFMRPAGESNCHLICSINDYYKAHYLINEIDSTDQMQRLLLRYNIPAAYLRENSELGFYFWNPDRDSLVVDNLSITLFQ